MAWLDLKCIYSHFSGDQRSRINMEKEARIKKYNEITWLVFSVVDYQMKRVDYSLKVSRLTDFKAFGFPFS